MTETECFELSERIVEGETCWGTACADCKLKEYGCRNKYATMEAAAKAYIAEHNEWSEINVLGYDVELEYAPGDTYPRDMAKIRYRKQQEPSVEDMATDYAKIECIDKPFVWDTLKRVMTKAFTAGYKKREETL